MAVSLTWLVLYNHRFWRESMAAMWQPSAAAVVFVASLFFVVWFLQSAALLLVPGRRAFRIVASVLFVVAALSAYFVDEYGVIIDRDMIRNVVETDVPEMRGLISTTLLMHLVLLGLLPAALLWRVDLPELDWRREFRQRAKFIAAGLALSVVALLASSASYASFFRAHKPIRFMIAPGAAIVGALSYLSQALQPRVPALVDPGGVPLRISYGSHRPLLLFLVIGETARGANFQLGGYERATNPELAQIDDVVYFNHVASCGTSTAVSVPCLFSHLGRAGANGSDASRYLNLLDMLSRAGFDVQWRDNNAGCKGVCARIESVRFDRRSDPSLCSNDYCYDEVMLSGLKERLRNIDRDTLIVFHQIGSHGPAYSQRYPREFERFKPVCRSSELDRCSRQELVNAYDNTILYTDHNLAAQVALLKTLDDRADTALLYVSDHGESLGERRIFLHGMPYAIAPQEQKRVPLIVWTSLGYRHRRELSESCLQARAGEPLTHDHVFHTVMGALGVRNDTYRADMDFLAPCEPALKARAGS